MNDVPVEDEAVRLMSMCLLVSRIDILRNDFVMREYRKEGAL